MVVYRSSTRDAGKATRLDRQSLDVFWVDHIDRLIGLII